MTELLESFVPPTMLLEEQHSEDTCPFCRQDQQKDGPRTVYEGDSAALGNDLGGEEDLKKKWWIYGVVVGDDEHLIRIHSIPNAHHVIPAEASLHGEQLHDSHPSGNVLPKHRIMQYMSASAKGTKVKADIGYDVNKEHNGIWLPSVPTEFKEKRYKKKLIEKAKIVKWGPGLSEGEKYAIAARFMHKRRIRRQWHQTHQNYSEKLESWLQGFVVALEGDRMDQCPQTSGANEDPPYPPPMGLLGRLKGLSGFLKPYMKGRVSNWSQPMFTSTHAATYFAAKGKPPVAAAPGED